MQQVVPDPIPDELAFNMTAQSIDEVTIDLVQNQTINNTEAHLAEMSQLFKQLRNDGFLRLIFQSIELTLMILALVFLPHDCFKTSLRDMFILAIVVNSFQAFRQLHLIYISVLDFREIAINGASNRLPYPDYSYQSTKLLLDAIADNNMCFKFQKYIIIILEISIFVQAQISIYSNLKSECEIGDSENDFTWGIAFMFLIIRYITVGLPLVLFILYLLIAPIAYCIHMRLQSKINRSGATDANINRLQFKTVENEKLTEDNECVICLQEFVTGEEYLILKCHPHHIYHRICIVDWIKARSECPKCRAPITFD